MKTGYDFLETYDIDGDGVPEGNPNEVKNTFDNLTLFGIDAYDITIFMAGCKAMIRMAEMVKDNSAKKQYENDFEKASEILEKLWRDEKNIHGQKL